MKRGFKNQAEQQAEYYRNELGLRDDQPLLANALAEYLGIKLIDPRDVPGITNAILEPLLDQANSSWSAVTVVLPKKHIVIYNPTHSAYRYESNIVHEAAHIICEHKPAEFVKHPVFDSPLPTYNKEQEQEAEWLGGCLKLPRNILLQAYKRGLDDYGISSLYEASIDMVRYRKNVTGVQYQLRRRKAVVK